MGLRKRYDPRTVEPLVQEKWKEAGVYHFVPAGDGETYAVDTPPPTVSGKLHLGHVYSYSHVDFLARFWRMKGKRVLYPMGFDDNGLPTEKLVEKRLGITASEVGREAFIEQCLAVSAEEEVHYENLWRRLGLSIDWRYTYRTIDKSTRRISQQSFLDLFRKGLAYRQRAPTIWCPECRTAIAQAELNELDLESRFVTLPFKLHDGSTLPIATTRPELLPACVAVFVNPRDERYQDIVGRQVTIPLFQRKVEVKADPLADMEKGSGAVMCCTFGDTTDVVWWHTHNLDLIEAIDRHGVMTDVAGQFGGLPVEEARTAIIKTLAENELLTTEESIRHEVRVHERCDTPVEYVVATQWFVKVLEYRKELLDIGDQVIWHPAHMRHRYRQWVENLGWDWCISRQRYFGVTFPVWYCSECGQIFLASEEDLPVDPTERLPERPCSCGSTSFEPETDVMDTWATSALTPQLVAGWLSSGGFDGNSFRPVTLRPQAHEIIRTWAFYSIVKSLHHFDRKPWQEAAISGWGLAPEGAYKISKSRGGGPVSPLDMIDNYSADAVRYWAASTGFGKDAIISEEKIGAGAKLVNKLWNVGRFSQRFLDGYAPTDAPENLTPADRWILSNLQHLIERVTSAFESYEYATAKSLIEVFFWNDLADNYLEMAKKRLYDPHEPAHEGGKFALYRTLGTILKLFAPFLPHITEEISQQLFQPAKSKPWSIHLAPWPTVHRRWISSEAELAGQALVEIATFVRRYKSERKLPLGAPLSAIAIASDNPSMVKILSDADSDLASVSRAGEIAVSENIADGHTIDLGAARISLEIREV